MSELKLTLACGDYDFLRPLINGEIQPQGIELNVLTMPSPERHGRMLRHHQGESGGIREEMGDSVRVLEHGRNACEGEA